MQKRIAKYKVKKSIICELICCGIILISLVGKQSLQMAVLSRYIQVILACVLLFACYALGIFNKKIWFPIIAGCALGMINFFAVRQNMIYVYFITSFVFGLCGVFFVNAKSFCTTLWKALFLFVAAFLLYYWIHSPDGYFLFYNTSRNYISVYLLETLAIMVFIYEKENKKVPLYIYIVTFVLSILAVGRTGIITTGGLFLGILIYRYVIKRSVSVRRKILYIIILLAVFIIGLIVFLDNEEFILSHFFSRFISDNSSSDKTRALILASYMDTLKETRNLLFGTNTNKILFLRNWNGNVHNSYLMIHASFGIVGVVVAIASIVRTLIKSVSINYIEFALVLAAFSVRCFFDYCFVGQLGDIILWICILLPMKATIRSGKSRKSGRINTGLRHITRRNSSTDAVS